MLWRQSCQVSTNVRMSCYLTCCDVMHTNTNLKRWKFVVPNFDQLFGYYFRVNLFYSSVIGLSRPKDVMFKIKPNNREVFFLPEPCTCRSIGNQYHAIRHVYLRIEFLIKTRQYFKRRIQFAQLWCHGGG